MQHAVLPRRRGRLGATWPNRQKARPQSARAAWMSDSPIANAADQPGAAERRSIAPSSVTRARCVAAIRYGCADRRQRCFAIVLDGGGHGVPGVAQCHARSAIRAAVASTDALRRPTAFSMRSTHDCGLASAAGAAVRLCGDRPVGQKLVYINAGGVNPMLLAARACRPRQISLILGVDKDYSYG